MTLFFSLLPVYLFGNLHCLGMCGPLVMLLGNHRFRWGYFLGRITSFTLAGLIAAEMGILFHGLLKELHIPALTSLLFGCFSFWMFLSYLTKKNGGFSFWIGKKLAPFHQKLSCFLLKDTLWTTFAFGFFTLTLPCGQTLLVFSACALTEDPWIGLFNGCAFALLTSPSLFLALNTYKLFPKAKSISDLSVAISALFVSFLAFFRALAELDYLPHLILNPNAPSWLHLVLF